MLSFDTQSLKKWFLSQKRDLPWRDSTCDPYAVWVSEVMLQQTQVSVVIPYFLRWMERFPTIRALAAAPIEEVIKLWEGLGYYSRARNLHAGAQYVVNHYNGILPSEEKDLKEIKGLGPYSIGAILSFAFHKKCTAVDGNVIRVLTRYFLIKEDVTRLSTKRKINQIAETILPDNEPWLFNEGLIELGATVCQKKAKCQKCPLKNSCQAYLNDLTEDIPFKSQKQKIEHLQRHVVIIFSEGHILLRQGKKGEIMHDLFEFPYFENSESVDLVKKIKNEFGLIVRKERELERESHSFTRFQVKLFPTLFKSKNRAILKDFEWHPYDELHKLPFSSGHRRVLHQVLNLCHQ